MDEHIRFKAVEYLDNKQSGTILTAMLRCWVRFFGPMQYLVFDQEGAITADAFGLACDRWSIRRIFAGTDAHTVTGLAESHIRLAKTIAMKLDADSQKKRPQCLQAGHHV